MENDKKMKLFVAGEYSADPDKWQNNLVRTFVIAESAEAAAEMIDSTNMITELPMNRPMVLS